MVSMLRGNHESREVSHTYGTYEECLMKYGHVNVWLSLCSVFDWIPIAAIIDTVFAVHGGLSPEAKTLDSIDAIQRNIEIPHTGALSDLTWSDPTEDIQEWAISPRGSGFLFGALPVRQFHRVNETNLIVRAHQLALEGFFYQHNQTILTVWSAPNYCYNCGNVAAILTLGPRLQRSFQVFTSAPGDPKHSPKRLKLPEYFL